MNSEQIFFEDVKEGTELPGFTFGPITPEHVVRWACARGNYNPIHYDKDFAREKGLPDVLVHGPFKLGLLDRMMRDWIGEHGWLKKIACSYRDFDVPGNVLTCKGKVVSKTIGEGEGCVHCEIWVQNQKGEVTVKGTAIAIIPLKGSRFMSGSIA